MSLKTKSIKRPKSQDDGIRISIMSRHTLPDGVTLDPEIKLESYDDWRPELSPPPTLIGAYYKRGMGWDEFAREFNAFLQQAKTQEALLRLTSRAMHEDVTIMCVEDSPEHCHRRLVAEACQALAPELEIILE